MNKKVMKKIKSQWVFATIFTAILGVSMLAPTEVSASEWRARTPEQIEITDRSHYDIIWGDTLWAISESSGVSVDTLVQINNIANHDLIYAGNVLIIEGNTVTVAEPNGNTESFEVSENKAIPIETPATTEKVFSESIAAVKPVNSAVEVEQAKEIVKNTNVVDFITPEAPKEDVNDKKGNFTTLPNESAKPVETPALPIEVPVVEAPVTEEPVVEEPVVEEPVVEAPVTEAPVVEAPVVEAPVVEAPIVEKSLYKQVLNLVSGVENEINVYENSDFIEVFYTVELGSTNQNIPESLSPTFKYVKDRLNNAGINYEAEMYGNFFVITVNK